MAGDLLFAVIGLLLVANAARATLQRRRFGVSVLELARVPAALGGELAATLHAGAALGEARELELSLSCFGQVTTGSGKQRSAEEHVMWADEAALALAGAARGPEGAAVPAGAHRRRARSRPHRARRRRGSPVPGVAVRPDPGGGTELRFAAGRHLPQALLLAFFAAVLGGGAVLAREAAPVTILCGIVAALAALAALRLAFGSLRVVARGDAVVLQRRLFGLAAHAGSPPRKSPAWRWTSACSRAGGCSGTCTCACARTVRPRAQAPDRWQPAPEARRREPGRSAPRRPANLTAAGRRPARQGSRAARPREFPGAAAGDSVLGWRRQDARRAGMGELRDGRRSAPAFALALASVWLAAAPAAAEWVDWIAQAELHFEFDDNLNRSAFDHDEESDFVWRPAAALGRVYQLGDLTRLALTFEAESAIYHEWEGLNAVQLGGTAAVIHKFGLGDVPELRVYGSAAYLNLRDDERDGMLYEGGAELSRAFGERLEGTLFGLYSWRDGNEGVRVLANVGRDVWDQRAFEVGARGSFLLTEQLQLGAGYSYRDGDFDSACTVGNVAKVITREGSNLKAIARDDVFGGCVYRLGGHLHTASVNLNYGLGRRFSVDLNYRFLYGEARELIYRSNVVGVAVLFRY